MDINIPAVMLEAFWAQAPSIFGVFLQSPLPLVVVGAVVAGVVGSRVRRALR